MRDMFGFTLPMSVTSNGRTFDLKYSMTTPTPATVSPYTVTVTATDHAGAEVFNNTKDITVTKQVVVTIDRQYVESDGTVIKVGDPDNTHNEATPGTAGTGRPVTFDLPAPTAVAGFTEDFFDPIFNAIVDQSTHGSSAQQANIQSSTSIEITYVGSDGGAKKKLTITLAAAGDATDKTKVMTALASATIV